jgi:hypothetical protein
MPTEALDRLQAAQPEIEQALARRHLKDGRHDHRRAA